MLWQNWDTEWQWATVFPWEYLDLMRVLLESTAILSVPEMTLEIGIPSTTLALLLPDQALEL